MTTVTGTFTATGVSDTLTLGKAGEHIILAISGTYIQTIQLERESGAPGSGAWVKVLGPYNVEDATVAADYYVDRDGERIRLRAVAVDGAGEGGNPGTSTYTFSDGDRIFPTLTRYDDEGQVVSEEYQSGRRVPGDIAYTGDLAYTGANTHTGAETHEGVETHTGDETHTGVEEHTGDETHTGVEEHTGDETHTGVEEHTGAETHTGAEEHEGVETHTGAETHSGIEEHTGAETHTGAEEHAGAEVITGTGTLSGARKEHLEALNPAQRFSIFEDFFGAWAIADGPASSIFELASGTDTKSTDAATVADAPQGQISMGSGDDNSNAPANMTTIAFKGLSFEAEEGELEFICRCAFDDVTTVYGFFGFTDVAPGTTLEFPIFMNAGDIDSDADNACGVLFDTDATIDKFWAGGVAATTDTAPTADAAVTPTNSAFFEIRVVVATDGALSAWVNGTQIATALAGAVTATVGLIPVIMLYAHVAGERKMTIDYMGVSQDRSATAAA